MHTGSTDLFGFELNLSVDSQLSAVIPHATQDHAVRCALVVSKGVLDISFEIPTVIRDSFAFLQAQQSPDGVRNGVFLCAHLSSLPAATVA